MFGWILGLGIVWLVLAACYLAVLRAASSADHESGAAGAWAEMEKTLARDLERAARTDRR